MLKFNSQYFFFKKLLKIKIQVICKSLIQVQLIYKNQLNLYKQHNLYLALPMRPLRLSGHKCHNLIQEMLQNKKWSQIAVGHLVTLKCFFSTQIQFVFILCRQRYKYKCMFWLWRAKKDIMLICITTSTCNSYTNLFQQISYSFQGCLKPMR